MKLQKSPVPNSCLATAFAMVMGVDTSLVLDILPDPNLVAWPLLPAPRCFRGHHIQELIDVADSLGFVVSEIEPHPCLGQEGSDMIVETTDDTRFDRYLNSSRGVLIVKGLRGRHAVAWDGSHVLDPKGRVGDIEDYQIITYYMIRIKS